MRLNILTLELYEVDTESCKTLILRFVTLTTPILHMVREIHSQQETSCNER